MKNKTNIQLSKTKSKKLKNWEKDSTKSKPKEMKKEKNLPNWLIKSNNWIPPSRNWVENQKEANKLCQANLKNSKTNSWLLNWLRKTKRTLTLKLLYLKERWKMLKPSETLNSESKKLTRENNNLITKSKELKKKKSHLKSNTPKSRKLLTRKMLPLMAWKKTLIPIKKNTWKKRKSTTRNGNNGRKPRRKDSMKPNKKSRNSINKLTNSGKTSVKTKKLTGNKSTTLIGSNGKWRSKAEKSTKFKEKREDLNTNKKIKNTKSKKNFKSTSEKSNSAIN